MFGMSVLFFNAQLVELQFKKETARQAGHEMDVAEVESIVGAWQAGSGRVLPTPVHHTWFSWIGWFFCDSCVIIGSSHWSPDNCQSSR